MDSLKKRKTDRRTLYTRKVIKEALLELLNEKKFDKISVSQLCQQAEITRTTFYSHYNNISDRKSTRLNSSHPSSSRMPSSA